MIPTRTQILLFLSLVPGFAQASVVVSCNVAAKTLKIESDSEAVTIAVVTKNQDSSSDTKSLVFQGASLWVSQDSVTAVLPGESSPFLTFTQEPVVQQAFGGEYTYQLTIPDAQMQAKTLTTLGLNERDLASSSAQCRPIAGFWPNR